MLCAAEIAGLLLGTFSTVLSVSRCRGAGPQQHGSGRTLLPRAGKQIFRIVPGGPNTFKNVLYKSELTAEPALLIVHLSYY